MKHAGLILIIIIISTGVIGSLGINWGTPDQDHMYTYNIDEMTFLMWLKNMNPSNFDFDPKAYSKTHLPVYYTAAVLKFGEILGLYKIGTKEYYKGHPEEFRNIILMQRIFFGKIPAMLIVLFSFLIGRILIDDTFGIMLAGVSGFLPTILVNNNYAVENVMVTLLVAITFYYALKFYESEKFIYILLSGVFTGLSMSTKQSGILGFIFVLSVLIAKSKHFPAGRIIKYIMLSGVACVAAFSLTSPYYMKFLLLKILFPSNISPDVHRGSINIMIPLNFSLDFMAGNMIHILTSHFVQLGGVLLAFVPLGVYWTRKNVKFLIIYVFIFLFFMIASVNIWATDTRIMPMAYFFAILGAAGIYYLFMNTRSNVIRGAVGSSLILSLIVYAGVVEFRYVKVDNARSSSEWIKRNILNTDDTVTIGLHASPYFTSPLIITKEWMHNKHPDSSYYPDNYNEIFVIPEYELHQFGGQQMLPDEELTSKYEKIQWLELMAPDYIVLSKSARDKKHGFAPWPAYFTGSHMYELIKHFPKYEVLGISYLEIYSFDIYIYKRVETSSLIINKYNILI